MILNFCKIGLMGLIQNYPCLLELRDFISSNLLLEGMGALSGDFRRRWLFSDQSVLKQRKKLISVSLDTVKYNCEWRNLD